MAVLNYRIHNSVADHKDFFNKLKEWAVDQGWTLNVYQQNKSWASIGGGQYGWVAGSEDYMELRSSGYGSQAMQFRFRQLNTGTSNNRFMEIGAFYGTLGYDTLSSVHPVNRASGAITNWNGTYRFVGLSSETMPTVWFFGNNKVIICVIKHNGTFIQTFVFGSIDVINSGETQGFYCVANLNTTEWYDLISVCPFDQKLTSLIYYNSVAKVVADYGISFYALDGVTPASSAFISYAKGSMRNHNFTSNRPMFRQDIYIKDTVDSRWFHLGYYPIYRLHTTNLLIGQEITYGSEKYLVFPWNEYNVKTYGFAIRIE